jgi:hypothetical protein
MWYMVPRPCRPKLLRMSHTSLRRSPHLARIDSRSRSARSRRALLAAIRLAAQLAVMVALAGCREHPEAGGPEEAVQQFIDGMQRVHGDIERASVAYQLLAKPDRDNLVERARRASAVAGRTLAPEEMLAPSRFYLEFQPVRWSSKDSGNYSVVTAQGSSPDQRREIRCVKEADGWKVLLDLPALPPIERRELADPATAR